MPGEDPYVTAQYVMNFNRGLQEGEDPRNEDQQKKDSCVFSISDLA